MNKTEESNSGTKRRAILFISVVSVIGAIVIGICFYLLKQGNQTSSSDTTQEQFVGNAEVSSQLQAECQASANKIMSSQDIDWKIEEFRKNAENCKDVLLSNDQAEYMSEGFYPELVVDLARIASKQSKAKALSLFEFAQGLSSWNFFGPVECDSKTVIAAYIESLKMSDQKVCYKPSEFREKLLPELKQKNFSVLSKALDTNKVVWMGLPNSDVGCPEKISAIIKVVETETRGDVALDEKAVGNVESGSVSFLFKSKEDDKIILQFSTINDCLELTSVVVPNLQSNE